MSQQSRREFLEQSMLASAAVAAASAAGPQVAGAAEKSAGPNDKLNVAVVGVRGRGGSHIGAFAGRGETQVTYICDADADVGNNRADQVAKKQGRRPEMVTDIRKVLDDKSVDIVSIATPNHWHALCSIWAIQAGKDVYVEKPVSHNVSEGRRIVEAARKYDKICQTGTQCRSNSGMIQAMKYIHDGGIGKVNVARGLCFKRRGSIGPAGKYKAPSSVDLNLWMGPAQMQPITRPRFHYDWHWQWPYGNGDLGNQGIHQMDIARWGLQVDKLSNSVISYGGRYSYEDAGDTANTQVVIHDYGDSALVFEVRGLKTPKYKGAGVGVIFEGTDGYVVISSYNGGAAFDKNGKIVKGFGGGGNHFGNFLEAVRSRKASDLTADIEEGHLSSALCHMGNISYRLGEELSRDETKARLSALKTSENVAATLERFTEHLKDNNVDLSKEKIQLGPQLAFDPESETFKDNDTANTMLTRKYREPFVVPEQGKV